MIIAIHGKFRSGKDTLSDLLLQDDKTFVKHAYADKPKQLLAQILNIPVEWFYIEERKNQFLDEWGATVGQLLVRFGTDAMRNHFDNEVWVKSTLARYSASDNWVLSDVRFPNEAIAAQGRGGLLVKIVGDPSGQAKTSTRDPNHISETAMDTWTDWDYVVTNDGTMDDLKRHAGNILRMARNKQLGHWQ